MEMPTFLIALLLFLSSYVCTVQGQCDAPPTIENAESNPTDTVSFINGTTVRYSCKFGFGMSGNDVYVCINNVWKGEVKCLKTCPFIRELENGRIINRPSYVVGSYINFECNIGYELVGYKSLLCRDDRAWRPSKPSCKIVSCGDFGNVPNADLYQRSSDGIKNDYGSQIKVTCHENYVLTGSPTVTCQADGTWERKPECRVSSCGTHAGLNSSCIYDSELSSDGSFLSMLCEDNTEEMSVTKVGSGNAMCFMNEWDEPDMACYCDCKIKADFTKVMATNLEANNFLKHNQKLDWGCKYGSRKANDRDVICKDGVADTPKCVTLVITTDRQVTAGPSDNVTSGSSNKTLTTPITDRDDTGISPILICAIVIGIGVLMVIIGVISVKIYKHKKSASQEKINDKMRKDEEENIALNSPNA